MELMATYIKYVFLFIHSSIVPVKIKKVCLSFIFFRRDQKEPRSDHHCTSSRLHDKMIYLHSHIKLPKLKSHLDNNRIVLSPIIVDMNGMERRFISSSMFFPSVETTLLRKMIKLTMPCYMFYWLFYVGVCVVPSPF